MRYLWTAFDKLAKPALSPIASLMFDDETREVRFHSIYPKYDRPKPVNFKSISEEGTANHISATEPLTQIKTLFDGPLVVNDFKAHITALDLQTNKNFNIYEIPEELDIVYPKETIELKKFLAKQLANVKKSAGQRWQSLLAEATIVYLELERRGVLKDGTQVNPIYELTTFSGRSKSMGFSIQGAVAGDDIQSTDRNQKVFICADWIAADPRGWALLSKDEAMQESYKTSDPYTYLAEKNGGTRADYKIELIRSIYSQNYGSVVFKNFPQLKEWVSNSWEQIVKDGYSTSVMGRKFYGPSGVDPKDWTPHIKRSVFNAQMQGSTAHAMHRVMVELHRRVPHSLMTELHDSVVLCTDMGSVKMVVDAVKDTMLHPFSGILPENPVFPLRVSIGGQWKKWNQLREYR
jgi:hypothetical protein